MILVNFSQIQGTDSFILISIEGRVITQQYFTEKLSRIDLANESKGIYLLKISTHSSAQVYKIIKQ